MFKTNVLICFDHLNHSNVVHSALTAQRGYYHVIVCDASATPRLRELRELRRMGRLRDYNDY